MCEKWVCGPSVIRENIAPDEVCAEKLMAHAKRSGGRALVDLCVANWDKLPVIVAKSWKTEKVAAQSRMELHAAHHALAVASGLTLPAPFRLKGHDALDWRKAVTESLSTEGTCLPRRLCGETRAFASSFRQGQCFRFSTQEPVPFTWS